MRTYSHPHNPEAVIPSVTTVLKVIHNEWLEAWRAGEIVKVALQDWHLWDPETPLDAFVRDNISEWTARQESEDRSDIAVGTAVHEWIREFHEAAKNGKKRQETLPVDPVIGCLCAHYQGWFDANVLQVEMVEHELIGDIGVYWVGGTLDARLQLKAGVKLGYGGRTTVAPEWAKIDVKTGSQYRDSWGQQLVGYDELSGTQDTLLTIRLDRKKAEADAPNVLFIKEWKDRSRLLRQFSAAVALWYALNA